jgi:serine protease Do
MNRVTPVAVDLEILVEVGTMRKKRQLALLLAFVLFISGAGVLLAKNHIFSRSLQFDTENKEVTSTDGFDTAMKLQSVYRKIAKSIMPATVSINVESEQVVQNPYSEFFNDPFFRRFFGDEGMGQNGQPKEFKRKLQAMGSGFIVTKDGYLFSNYHVVKGATKIVVVLADNRKFDAKVVGSDPETDIALLKINANNLPVVPIGDSGDVQVGDLVVAIGNPFGLSGTFTTGAISFIGRPGMSGFQKLIQTDTPINPGNSGGPLVNIQGQVIGINAAIQSTTGGYQGIGFAIPINTVKNIAGQIVDHGKIDRGYIGVNISPIDATTRKIMGLADNEGVMVSKLEKDSPAEKAGLKKGDIITRVNDETVSSPEDLQITVGSLNPGARVKVEFYRDRKKMTVDVKLNTRPGETAGSNKPGTDDKSVSSESYEFLGAQFSEASKEYLDQNGADYGVVVKSIKDDGALAGALEPGLIVSQINGTEIHNLKDLKGFAGKNKDGKSFTFLIVKEGFVYYRGIEK